MFAAYRRVLVTSRFTDAARCGCLPVRLAISSPRHLRQRQPPPVIGMTGGRPMHQHLPSGVHSNAALQREQRA